MSERIKGAWYWIQDDNDGANEWRPAMYEPAACGGWTNCDTWEDLFGNVIRWRPIIKPSDNLLSDLAAYLDDAELAGHAYDEWRDKLRTRLRDVLRG